MDSGEKRLAQLGYKQELKRGLTAFGMLAITMSSISIFTGIVPFLGTGLLNGGTIGPVWGWWVVSFFVHILGLALSEICSSFPTTGSIYFWAAALAGPVYGPFAGFITAWLEFIGAAFVVGTQAYAGTQLLQYIILIYTGGANGGGYLLSPVQFLAIVALTIFVCACISMCNIETLAKIDTVSVVTQVATAVVLVIALPVIAPTKQPASFVFNYWQTNRDITGLPNDGYSWVISLLLAQYAIFGFDAAAHMTEETKSADRTGPLAIMASISIFSVVGWIVLLALLFCISDYSRVILDPTSDTVTGGTYPLAQILWDAFNSRYGSGNGAIVLLAFIYWSFFFGCLSVLISGARVAFALSRDNGLPFPHLWRKLSKDKVPYMAVLLTAFLGFLVVVPVVKSNVVFFAVTSLGTAGWFASYGVPIFFRIIASEKSFIPGPFYLGNYLGKACKLAHVVALCWVIYTVVAFQLPLTYPITVSNFNYAPLVMGTVIVALCSWWVLDARFWFKGPIREIETADSQNATLVD